MGEAMKTQSFLQLGELLISDGRDNDIHVLSTTKLGKFWMINQQAHDGAAHKRKRYIERLKPLGHDPHFLTRRTHE
jgi:hypothetical protein